MQLYTALCKALAHGQSSFVAAGCVYQISCRQLVIEAVHKVHTGGVTALAVGPRVCATAGRDHRLRIWRLDFGTLLLEVCSKYQDATDVADAQKPRPMTALLNVAGCSHILEVFRIMSRTVWPQPRASTRPRDSQWYNAGQSSRACGGTGAVSCS